MSDLRDLYQEIIIDHSKNPRNFCCCPAKNREAEGYNPLCGDQLTVYLRVQNDMILDISFLGSGCAISTASASLMTEALKGKTVAFAEQIFTKFHDSLVKKESVEGLGKLEILTGVSEFPMRVKCATLAWHTLKAALNESAEIATTE